MRDNNGGEIEKLDTKFAEWETTRPGMIIGAIEKMRTEHEKNIYAKRYKNEIK